MALEDSKPKEIFSIVPVVHAYAIENPPVGKEDKTVYICPVYSTVMRGATFVFQAQFKTREKPDRVDKWTCGGVCAILDIEGVADTVKTK